MSGSGRTSPAFGAGKGKALTLLAEARAFIASAYACVCESETVPTATRGTGFLAEDVRSPCDLPRFDAAAVDGIAVRRSDLVTGATTQLKLVGRAAAGHPFDGTVPPRSAVRIFTGAAVPDGCDAIVMQEDCVFRDPLVFVDVREGQGSNIRRRGEDVMRDEVVLRKGTRMTPARWALAGALGLTTVLLRRPLRVTVFSSGDEVTGAGSALTAGLIRDANRPLLLAMIVALGCDVRDGGILPDDADRQVDLLHQAAAESDLLVTSGGMSEGEEDHLPGVIRRRGFLEIWKLAIKPGKPVGLGDIDDCPIVALPGNPIAAAVTFSLLGNAVIERLSGATPGTFTSPMRLPLAEAVSKKSGRFEAVPVTLVTAPGSATLARPVRKQGSAMLSSLADCTGFVGLPEDMTEAGEGDVVDYYPFAGA
ncbi:gephyrin-like molybdotransferase Glp [Aestuariivirga sp.]|uniref:molybdopterin molybdotransferase MoeA n=1 Tax=Aestuariivirga sp. TaxID=2650926 RepID=UPI0039E4CEA4